MGLAPASQCFQDRQALLSLTPPGHGAESGSRTGEKSVGGAGKSAKDGRKWTATRKLSAHPCDLDGF